MQTKNNGIYITAILPAHNESKGILPALKSVRPHVDKIIVACDNCSDDTFKKAKQGHADVVFNTIKNHHRKAGALNQALEKYVDWDTPNQYILIMDADTIVVKPNRWFKKATSLVYPNRPKLSNKARYMSKTKKLELKLFHRKEYKKLFSNKSYDCVGSIFQAPPKLPHNSNLEEGQRLEWESYEEKVERSRKTFVLTGTCSLISAKSLKLVYKLNNNKFYYNDYSITEDFCMTIDLKEVYSRLISPTDCQCITATKSSIKGLISQRKRWYKGAIDLVAKYPPDRVMYEYDMQQVGLFLSVIAYFLFIGVSVYLYITGSVELTILWSVVFLCFDCDQVARVWKYSNTFDKLYSIAIFGCLWYSFLLDISYTMALFSCMNKRKMYWNSTNQHKGGRKQ